MDPRLVDYYNQELAHLRETGAEFAQEFPKIAARLGMEGLEVADPYVERLMESFAFVAARIQLKIDAEFPRFTQHLLEIVFPHYLAPTPSYMVVELLPKMADTALARGVRVPRGAAIRSVVPKGEQTACEFRTAHEVTLWPIAVSAARAFTHAADLPIATRGLARPMRGGLRIRLAAQTGQPFAAIDCDQLDFYLTGPDEIAGPLHELVASQCIEALVVSCDSPPRLVARLGAEAVTPQGFGDDQALLPFGRRSFQGYRLLREYFVFPGRYRFFRVSGLRRALGALTGSDCELVLLFGRNEAALEPVVDASNVVLHATPIVNLFHKRADRVQLAEGQHEHHLLIDRARPADYEVFSVVSVRGLADEASDATEFLPFYGDVVHHDASAARAFFTVRREPRVLSERQRQRGSRTSYVGSEVFLSVVDEREAPYPQPLRQLAVEVIATNRDLPLLLPMAAQNVLMLQDSAPVDGLRILKAPSRPRTGVADGDFAWRLISHLSLNYLSLFDTEGAGGAVAALRQMLMLYADIADPAVRRQCESVIGLSARPVTRRLPMPGPIVFGRGLEIDVTINESAFGGAGGYQLGAVLERFLARHVSINSFTETRLLSESRGEVARWPARTGRRNAA